MNYKEVSTSALEPGDVYHIYNCANGDENLFREKKNYGYFIEKYFQYITPVAETYAWCLMPNHFHIMLRVKDETGLIDSEGLSTLNISKQFSNLFNAYTKAINKMYDRRGNLFRRPFRRKKVKDDSYFIQLILYIHNNPVKHGFVEDMYQWPHSSIHQFLDRSPDLTGFENLSGLGTNINEVLDWFDGQKSFIQMHKKANKMQQESVFD